MTILEFKPKPPVDQTNGIKWVCECGSDLFRLIQEDGDPDWCGECSRCGETHIPEGVFHVHER